MQHLKTAAFLELNKKISYEPLLYLFLSKTNLNSNKGHFSNNVIW